MNIGDLVTVAPAKTGLYIITSLDGHHSVDGELPECVMLAPVSNVASYSPNPLPMEKKWVEVISENKI